MVIATCLLPARDLPPTPFSQFDKIEHFSAYLAMSAYAGMLFARMRPQAIAAIGLIAMGVGLEFAQAQLTDSRSGDAADALANGLGAWPVCSWRARRWRCGCSGSIAGWRLSGVERGDSGTAVERQRECGVVSLTWSRLAPLLQGLRAGACRCRRGWAKRL
ncbi:VanZ family protein [Lysobacter capsici]|uniref:hypothetical protein n=1 Tax=Lysobacter capsici TaxID=435897 RepID=UPI00398CECAD